MSAGESAPDASEATRHDVARRDALDAVREDLAALAEQPVAAQAEVLERAGNVLTAELRVLDEV